MHSEVEDTTKTKQKHSQHNNLFLYSPVFLCNFRTNLPASDLPGMIYKRPCVETVETVEAPNFM